MIIMLQKWITPQTKKVLLVEPDYPYPKNRTKNYQPIGLLKISTYLKKQGIQTKLIQHNKIPQQYTPDLILITTIFTYWSQHVKKTTQLLQEHYPNTPIITGGVYASLMPEHCKQYTDCTDVITGPIPEVENLKPDYTIYKTNYQVLHTTRGCIRRCPNCGVYQIEPQWTCKKTIKNELTKRKLVFYDNNILANTYIEDILKELIWLKKLDQISNIDSQSGFDARILVKKPHLAKMLKQAGFINIRIAWDGPYKAQKTIKKAIQLLTKAGYPSNKISVFMIYNYTLPYDEIEKKRIQCYKWQVPIIGTRYIPLDATTDNYNPRKKTGQTNQEYYIHPDWTDQQIRKIHKNIRKHNICVRHNAKYWSLIIEQGQKQYKNIPYEQAIKEFPDAWNPATYHPPDEKEKTKSNFYGKLGD